MTYATKTILVDAGGKPIPQIWDGTNFVPYGGKVTVEGVADVKLTGSKAEQASAQHTKVATTVETYSRPVGASRIELYCESGYVRVRTDGQPCTSTTGEPVAPGFGATWDVGSISVYYIQGSVITVVSR